MHGPTDVAAIEAFFLVTAGFIDIGKGEFLWVYGGYTVDAETGFLDVLLVAEKLTKSVRLRLQLYWKPPTKWPNACLFYRTPN